MTINEEKQLRSFIRKAISESILDTIEFDEAKKKIAKKKKAKKEDNGSSTETIDKSKAKGMRKRVIQALKNDGTDCAPYAYKLWPDKEKENARSQFYKCRDGALNDNGDAYSFTDAEITRLHSLLSDTLISAD